MKMYLRVGKKGIADALKSFGMTEQDFMRENGYSESKAHIGSVVILNIEDDLEYIVRPFDTIEKIAAIHHVDADLLRRHNNIDRVFLGDKIYIPKQ